MRRVRFSRFALADLEDIARYISRDNVAIARRVVNRIEMLCFLLGTLPGIGRDSEVSGARKLVIPHLPYKIIYESRPKTVVILRVYHNARDSHF